MSFEGKYTSPRFRLLKYVLEPKKTTQKSKTIFDLAFFYCRENLIQLVQTL